MDKPKENASPIIEAEKSEIENSLNYSLLPTEEKGQVDKIVETMDVSNSNAIMHYAAEVQGKMAAFSDNILNNVKSAKTGEVGDVLASLVAQINDFDAASVTGKPNVITQLFKRAENAAEKLIAKYSKVESNIDKILLALEKSKIQMMKDIAVFEHMYEENLKFFKEISLYIIAGEMKIKHLKEVDIPKLEKIAAQSKEQIDAQAVNDMSDICNKLEKKIHDLKLTRIISIQMAPQIRMMQNNEIVLAEKIQSSIVNTIPLWKSQLLLALGVANSTTAYKLQNSITEATNELLKKNSELLKQGSIDIARESERSIIDIETLRQTNANIISTIEEVISIHREGAKMRLATEQELLGVEQELKEKLNEIRSI